MLWYPGSSEDCAPLLHGEVEGDLGSPRVGLQRISGVHDITDEPRPDAREVAETEVDVLRVAVTGATGFLGTYLTRRLISDVEGVQVTGVSRRPPRTPISKVMYSNDLTEDELAELDVLFHLSGSGGISPSIVGPAEDLRANTIPTLAYLEAIREVGAKCIFLLASSSAVYGKVEGAAIETQPLAPRTPYGASKLAAETYASVYRHLYGIDERVARIANPYGPGQRKLAVYELVTRALREGPPLRVRGRGLEVRDFIHADDVARALIDIALRGEAGGIYNVGSGERVALREVAALVASTVGFSADEVVFEGFDEPGKVRDFSPDVSRLRTLGFAPHRSLQEGINDVVEWLRSGA